jgi:hypothetical protein
MPSTTLIVLFNLKPGVTKAAYEDFALNLDIPTVERLDSVDFFRLYQSTAIFGSDATPPYQYVEVIKVNDLDGLVAAVQTETVGKVVAAFQDYAENPLFLMCDEVQKSS